MPVVVVLSSGMAVMLSGIATDAVVLGIFVCLAVCFMAWLLIRHRVLLGRRGAFLCALRTMGGDRPGQWMVGTARYEGGSFEWYRTFDPRLRPTITLRRGHVTVTEHHRPTDGEGLPLVSGAHEVVTVATGRSGRSATCQLVVEPCVVTGFLSWLEAEPPGGTEYAVAGHLA